MGKINMHNLRTPSTEQAREMQKKSAEKRSQNIKERKLIRQVIEERLDGADLEEIVAIVADAEGTKGGIFGKKGYKRNYEVSNAETRATGLH